MSPGHTTCTVVARSVVRCTWHRIQSDPLFFGNIRVSKPVDFRLRAVVEVVPMVASANPVVISRSIVSLVVGVGRRVVQLASLGVLASGLSIEGGGGLTVKSLEHLRGHMSIRNLGYGSSHKMTILNILEILLISEEDIPIYFHFRYFRNFVCN